jgi:hypothetical protein
MALLNQQFNAANLPQSDNNFDPIPAGWYDVTINGAELKTTKAGTGQYIAVRYDVVGPTHQGRVVFGNLNISNPNPKAEEIGHQQLGDLMRAIGLAQVTDTDQLVGGSCQIKVSIRKSEEYGDSNDVKAWKAGNGAPMQSAQPMQQAQPQSAQAPQQPQMPAAGATPPWQR